MATKVTTTVVANFDGGAAGASQFDAEIDTRENGFNGGKSSFVAGDQPAYLVRRSPNVVIDSQVASVGVIGIHVIQEEEEVTEFLLFDETNVATLSQHALPGTLTFKWLGTNLGNLTLSGIKDIEAAVSGVAVAQVTYTTSFDAFFINNIPVPLNGESTFPVLVVINGTENLT